MIIPFVKEPPVIDDKGKKAKHRDPHKQPSLKMLERKYSKDRTQPTDIEEVWFAGCHTDVGGGSVPNETEHTLASIALRWMVRETFKTNSGIMFDAEGLQSIGLDPGALYPEVLPRPPALPVGSARIRDIPTPTKPIPEKLHSDADDDDEDRVLFTPIIPQTEEERELKDALSPIYDQLFLAKWWWILEILPMKQRYQRGDNSWGSYFGWNLGQGRYIPKQQRNGVRVHRSVKMRMEAMHEDGKTKYAPRANLDLTHVIWVD